MADTKLTALTETTSPALTDDVYVVTTPGGTPASKRCTIGNLKTAMGITATAAYASPPTAKAAGDLWLPSDSFYAERATAGDSSHWVPWGPIFPMTPPPAVSGLTWVNQGSSTTTETYGGVYLYTPAVAADNLRILKKAATAPYTITLAFLMQAWNAGNQACGFCWRQSGGGAAGYVVTVSLGYVSTLGNGLALASNKWTAATAWSANYFQQPILPTGGPFWLRCADNNTNRIVSWSPDGQNWLVIHTIGRTDFITADEVGFFVQSGSATYPIGMTLLSWLQA